MKCPVCNNHEHNNIDLSAAGFAERIFECPACEATWSINHGLAEIVNDPNQASFLSALAEEVDGDDYCWA